MRCRAYTKDGTRCRNEAIEGHDFCRVHLDYDGPLAPVEEEEAVAAAEEAVVTPESPQEDDVEVIYADKKFPIRYIGKGSYHVGDYHFYREGQVEEVPRDLFEYLVSLPYFEDASKDK